MSRLDGSGSRRILAPSVLRLLNDEPARLVWENQLGGLTFDVGTGPARRFVKWTPHSSGIDLGEEARRLAWAVEYTPVPRLLAHDADRAGSWLVTSPLPGDNAVTAYWRARPATAVAAIGRGLRALHDALPVDGCPFSWSAGDRIAQAMQRAGAGLISCADWESLDRSLPVDAALRLVASPPPVDRLVVCQGDACSPNTLLTVDGEPSGHVDLGTLGTADRWADLAIATLSTQWNYGPGWEAALLEAYGVAVDPARVRYYRLLWDLGP